jgi:hypothetical protein
VAVHDSHESLALLTAADLGDNVRVSHWSDMFAGPYGLIYDYLIEREWLQISVQVCLGPGDQPVLNYNDVRYLLPDINAAGSAVSLKKGRLGRCRSSLKGKPGSRCPSQ